MLKTIDEAVGLLNNTADEAGHLVRAELVFLTYELQGFILQTALDQLIAPSTRSEEHLNEKRTILAQRLVIISSFIADSFQRFLCDQGVSNFLTLPFDTD